MKLKIAIVVHGRFHAFDLARELINLGHDVTLFTNYPKTVVEKFGIPQECVQSFLLHGILSRIIHRLHKVINIPNFEQFLHIYFSRWASKRLLKDNYDIIHVFSGVAEEIFQKVSNQSILKTLIRGSSHIRTQFQILSEEENRVGKIIDKPSVWMIAREEREYQLADIIIGLSSFAKQSFLDHDIDLNKIKTLPLGTQLSKFRPQDKIIQDRCKRILSSQQIRILMVGNFSFQKGIYDLFSIASKTHHFASFRFVGAITNEALQIQQISYPYIHFFPKQPQFNLPEFYAEADIFIFTTIQDGYAMVLSQAQAAGLPILTTTNCSGPDIIVEGQTGWVLPIRSPEKFIERLEWCHEHREELAQMVWNVYHNFKPRDWADVAADFAAIHIDLLQQKSKEKLCQQQSIYG